MPATSERAAGGNRLVFLHGFTQTHHHWHQCAHLIADRLPVAPTLAFVDLPGHGLSSEDRSEIVSSGPALADLAGSGTYIGYSMGGRFALVAGLARWGLIERLVLIGATPGIDDEAQRRQRRRLDEERAERVEQIGVDASVDEWLAAPMFASLPPDPAGLEQRRRNTADGLTHSLRWCGTGNQVGLWQVLHRLPIPVLVIAGEFDAKFTEIARRMADALPVGTFASIAEAGHAAHSEQPVATADAIADWLMATDDQVSPGPARR